MAPRLPQPRPAQLRDRDGGRRLPDGVQQRRRRRELRRHHKIFLVELTQTRRGEVMGLLKVPNSSQRHVGPTSDQMVTKLLPLKSELALNLSTDGQFVSFMGESGAGRAMDASNSNTPFVIDPTTPGARAGLPRRGRGGRARQFPLHQDQRLSFARLKDDLLPSRLVLPGTHILLGADHRQPGRR